jgi:AcrR family transcriptional regulator
MSDDDPKPARGRPRTMNAEKVLDVAMTAYWQSDPADVSVNAICQMAGISKPSLYREFGSEDGLSRAVLDRYAEQVLSEMFVILHGGKGLRGRLTRSSTLRATIPGWKPAACSTRCARASTGWGRKRGRGWRRSTQPRRRPMWRSCKLPAMPGSGPTACRSRPGRNIWASRSRLPSPNARRAKTPPASAKC